MQSPKMKIIEASLIGARASIVATRLEILRLATHGKPIWLGDALGVKRAHLPWRSRRLNLGASKRAIIILSKLLTELGGR